MAAKRILIVDDEVHIRRVVEMKLQGAGYEVRTATNVSSALELIQSFLPQLVISDYRMPGELNGLDFIRRLRATVGLSEVPVILLTGSVAITQQLLSSVPDCTKLVLISKPFSPRRLLQSVQQMLGETLEAATCNANA